MLYRYKLSHVGLVHDGLSNGGRVDATCRVEGAQQFSHGGGGDSEGLCRERMKSISLCMHWLSRKQSHLNEQHQLLGVKVLEGSVDELRAVGADHLQLEPVGYQHRLLLRSNQKSPRKE